MRPGARFVNTTRRYKKCYIRVLVNKAEQTVIFFYEDGSCGRDVLVNFLGDAELKTTTLKNTDHQVCMAHTKARFVKAEDSGGDSQAHIFNECFKRLYGFEHLYDKDGDGGYVP